MSPEEYKAWLDQQEVIERNGATYIKVDGVEYPLGTEPDPSLTGEDLRVARAKENVWMWTLRFGILGIIVLVVLIIVFSIMR